MSAVSVVVNGRRLSIDRPPMTRLLDVLRGELGLTGAKDSCGEGECGACSVLLDGEPVLACLVPIFQCHEREIETVEHLASLPATQGLLVRLVAAGGVQCGACTPGIVVTACALLRRSPQPTRVQVDEALAGNLCRCTGYEGIRRGLACAPASTEETEPL